MSVYQAMLGGRVALQSVLEEGCEVEVQEGAQYGDVVRVKGMGMPDVDGRRRGDLYAHLKVVVPTRLTAEERRLVEQASGVEEGSTGGGLLEGLKRWVGLDH